MQVPCPPFNLRLSCWDVRLPPLYSKRILCFSLPNLSRADATYDGKKGDIVRLLHTALKSTVNQLQFLAGSIVPYSKAQPWLRDIRPYGAAWLDIKDLSSEISFGTLRASNFSQHLLDPDVLCSLPKEIYFQEDPVDVCRFQANFVDGGLLLTVHVIHVVCDGRGITNVLQLFAEQFREAQNGARVGEKLTSTCVPSEAGRFDVDRRKLVCGHAGQVNIENHPIWTLARRSPPTPVSPQVKPSTKTSNPISKTFHIDAHMVSALKSAASRNSEVTVSTHDAISALIWRSIMIGRCRAGIIDILNRSSDDIQTHLGMAIDCRSRLNLSPTYLGNAIHCTRITLPLSHLEPSATDDEGGLRIAAQSVRRQISQTTGESFRDVLSVVEATMNTHQLTMSLQADFQGCSMFLVSYWSFEMYDLDFGEALGRIEAFRMPLRGLLLGIPAIMPRLKDGGCEFMICEQSEVIQWMMADATFCRYVESAS